MAEEPPPSKEARAIQGFDPAKIAQSVAANPTGDPNVINTPQVVKPSPTIRQNPEPPAIPNAPKADVTPKFFDEVKPDEEKKDASTDSAESAVSEEGDGEEPSNPGAENFKKLRTAHREVKKTLAEITKEKEEIAAKLKAFETGEVVSDIVRQKDEEIARLTPYEKMVNLKQSKEYKEKFINPLQDTKAKLKEIFADYGVPQESLDAVVNKAINTQKRPELNSLLLDHLGNDELGATEAKNLIYKAWDIQKQAQAAEAEPTQALETLQQEHQAIEETREAERRNRIIKIATNTWTESLNEVREEGSLLELIHKEDDPEFNAAYPDRILPQAAKEYGKIVTELGKQGITDLPKPLAKAIAKMVLLAHASGVAVETRNRAMDHVDTLTQNLTRHHNQLRPQIGGGVARSGAGQAPAKPLTPEQEAYNITRSILTKR